MNKAGSFQDAGLLNKTTAKAVWRYATRPEIMPRIRGLGIHFGHFAYLIALVLRSARLLPATHPALNPKHLGRFGIRHLLGEAASNLRWSWQTLDQIAIFGAVVAGIIMIVIQLFIISAMAVFDVGAAQAQTAGGYFETPAEYVQTDVVLIMLEQVFGPNLNLFGTSSQPLGTPVYLALQALLGFYSTALMVIAVIVVLYYVMVVVAEAAQTGTPFGKRFNSYWAPIRLVVALGLLVPLGSGLNSAQYATLWIAKLGSGFGTMAWTTFVKEVTAATDIVSKPAGESTAALVQRVFLNEVCTASYNQSEDADSHQIQILQVTGRRSSVVPDFANPENMTAAARAAKQDDVVLSWSRTKPGRKATDFACGKISVSITEFDAFSDGEQVTIAEERWWWGLPWIGPDMDQRLGTIHGAVKNAYLAEIKRLSDALRPAAVAIAAYNIPIHRKPTYGDDKSLEFIPELLREQAAEAHANINATIQATYESITQSEYASSGGYDEMLRRGWGAAGLWYGTLGTINKKYMDAVASAIPTLDILFEAAEVTENERGAMGRLFGLSRYKLPSSVTSKIEETISFASNDFAGYVAEMSPESSPLYEDARFEEAHEAGSSGWLTSSLLWMLGGNQLRDMKNNPDLDPMVRLAGAGHSMVTRALVFAGAGTALGIGGTVLSAAPDPRAKFVGELTSSLSMLLFVFAGIALTAGIFLAYVLPIIPFIYFAFAVIGWILEIFEAVVAMPLWALGHLRIEGDGLPGPGALGGYQLLLMILLRPALIILGLIGGYIIFGAAIYFFGTLFNAATAITQSDIASNSIGAVGIFVYTIIYTFLTYNIALMCFKMIDDVPKGILRWMGAGISPFSDSRGDPINGAREMVAGGAAAAIGLSRGMQGAGQGFKKANDRRQMRNQGVDPDNPIQQVRIVDDRRPPSDGE